MTKNEAIVSILDNYSSRCFSAIADERDDLWCLVCPYKKLEAADCWVHRAADNLEQLFNSFKKSDKKRKK